MQNTTDQVTTKQDSRDRVPFSQLAAYGSGGIIPIALFNVASILVGLMGNISLGLSAFWLGLILIIPRLWDSISDPLIGHISDNTRSRWGRRRPYLFIGGILTAVFFVVLWWMPKESMIGHWFDTESGFQTFQLIYILVSLIFFFTAVTLFEIPHGALGMEMTTDYHERTRLFSAKSFAGNLFAMSTPWLFALANMKFFKGTGGTEIDGMRYVSMLVAALLIPLSFWWFFKLKEPKFQKTQKLEKTPFWTNMKLVVGNRNFISLTLTIFTLAMGFNFVQLLGSYIPIFYVYGGDKVAGAYLLGINGTVWAITGVLAVFPLNWISPKLGKRNTLILAIILMVLAQLSKIVCYNPEHPYLILIPTALLSIGMLFFFTLGSSMVGDICDEDELNTGHRSEGSYYAVFWWFIKLGTALASFVAGALIIFTLFDESQVTKVDKVEANFDVINTLYNDWEKDVENNTLDLAKMDMYRIQALEEAQAYQKVLNKSLANPKDNPYKQMIDYPSTKTNLLQEQLSEIEPLIAQLSQKDVVLNTLKENPKQLHPLLLQPTLLKTQMNVLELNYYLKNRMQESDNEHKNHYSNLHKHLLELDIAVQNLKGHSSLSVARQHLKEISKEIVALKRQTPYTLLMMRVVEIGLPILLSIFSFIFVLRYTLTEKRSLEIKNLLRLNNNQDV